MDTLLQMQAWHDSHTLRQRADDIAVERFDSSSQVKTR
jgi:hypothetical protein